MESINPETVSSRISAFSSNKYIDATKEFLDSNSLVAKATFLLFALFLYMMLFRIGMMIIMYFYGPGSIRKLVDGMIPGNLPITINQNPQLADAKTIHRSNNKVNGIEFTWSVWLYIDQSTISTPTDAYKHVFHKGNLNLSGGNGMNYPNNGPGLYISPMLQSSSSDEIYPYVELTVAMSTFDNYNKTIEIPNIPLNKWFNIIIRCKNTLLDVYVNGTIAKSETLDSVPKQNFGDVYVTQQGGFNGNLSNLLYYSSALGIADIQSIASKGPSTYAAKISGSGGIGSSMNNLSANYLATQWYFDGLTL
jgi:hypothetical protein